MFAEELARQALIMKHKVFFVKRKDSPTPFSRTFNLFDRPETMKSFLEEIAEFHNFCEKYRGMYCEELWDGNEDDLHVFVRRSMAEAVIDWSETLSVHEELGKALSERAGHAVRLLDRYQVATKHLKGVERAKVVIEHIAATLVPA